MQGNPWFWGEHVSRWTFERELERTAVQLRDKNARVTVPKVSIEDVRNRKNALAAKGVLVSTVKPGYDITRNSVTGIVGTTSDNTATPRKIK